MLLEVREGTRAEERRHDGEGDMSDATAVQRLDMCRLGWVLQRVSRCGWAVSETAGYGVVCLKSSLVGSVLLTLLLLLIAVDWRI